MIRVILVFLLALVAGSMQYGYGYGYPGMMGGYHGYPGMMGGYGMRRMGYGMGMGMYRPGLMGMLMGR
ncbi:CaeNaCin (Caenorhabditis bacteriocin) [Caenorhabditis elegans]|uniref:CaeNaCin (Caenorhabditis bacteriocin) n=1 Tax=Caenorhabditis elegans TaxID=6239 RepID=Q9U3E5_CAEEL|nr:CaeNaCin (Caenorhabditis bacteriocin) [Caenorhabditis elegans]CAB63204.1 CaeNaCin (Caenorhabditis bacteriocin) [Caenorhabditis elegans]|eukprot:NP_507930.1 CaeNaCin (Caenorhabditis bacteriocin) [Caenorhabditis elegans]